MSEVKFIRNEPQVFVEKTMDHLPKFVELRKKFEEKFGF